MREAWLAAAYLASAVALGAALPAPATFAAFHAASAVWYACRWGRVQGSPQTNKVGPRRDPSPARARLASRSSLVASSLAQFPLHNPSATIFPFVVSTMLPRASHIMTCLQCVLCTVAVLFDGALALSFASTTVALFGFGSLSSSADTRTFALTILAHLSRGDADLRRVRRTPPFRLMFGVFRGSSVRRGAGACGDQRLPSSSRGHVGVPGGDRGSVFTLTFRALVLPGHVSTAALGVCAASA